MKSTEIDIGNLPPMAPDEERDAPNRRGQISLRWLAGTMLTGCAGCALLAGALFTAFDKELHFADSVVPEAQAALRFGDPSDRKGDRIELIAASQPTRTVIHDSAVQTVGDKEFIGIRPYVRISAPLQQSMGRFAGAIPAFDPVAIYASAGAWESDSVPEDTVEPEDVRVRVQTSPLAIGYVTFADSTDTGVDDIVSEVRDTLAYASAGTLDPTVIEQMISGGDGVALDLTGEFMVGAGDAATGDIISGDRDFDLSTIGGADVTQSVTILERTGAPLDVGESERVDVVVGRGDTLMTILTAHGCTRNEASEIVRVLADDYDVVNLVEGQIVRLYIGTDALVPDRSRPIRVSLNPELETLPVSPTVALASTGDFISLRDRLSRAALRSTIDSPVVVPEAGQATVFQSLYATGYDQGLDREMIEELIRIFSFDLDFQRRVSPGDSIELFYALPVEEDGLAEEEPSILYASVTTRGETHTFYRFRTPDDGAVDFYDEDGRSAKQFLMRKPIARGTFRSGFGMRRHPILGYMRMHNGADWAARSGTPIMAAGDGIVTHAGWKSGYGRHISIRHANGYQTTYSHMSAYASGIAEGSRVRLGQVIAYVGSSGLSSGPHLHYEVLVNGRFVDPMRIRLPRGRVLESRMLADFERERARIDALMDRAVDTTQVAQAGN